MKKLLVGLLVLGSISSFATILEVENLSNPDNINLEVKADRVVTAENLDTVTYFGIRLESEDVIIDGLKVVRFVNESATRSSLCEYLGHSQLASYTSSQSDASKKKDLGLYSRVTSDKTKLTLERKYFSYFLIDVTCYKKY
ncbi:MAG: hypothetical protein N4A33_07805 [Bacteriovoracaceae bacterium]|jgi:hypothetical protein|nr:hypothetical protein [Bacteriovoracaceae bacterium]